MKEAEVGVVQRRMQKQAKALIRETALALLRAAPSGLRYRELHAAICEQLPSVSPSVVADAIHTLRHSLPPGFSVEKGVYRNESNGESSTYQRAEVKTRSPD